MNQCRVLRSRRVLMECVMRLNGELLNTDTLTQVIALMGKSPIHKVWSYSDVVNIIAPPIQLGQYITAKNGDEVLGYASWAWLSIRAQDVFISRSRKLLPADWNSGPCLWIMDVLTVEDYNPGLMMRKLRKVFLEQTTANKCLYRREYSDGREVIKEMKR